MHRILFWAALFTTTVTPRSVAAQFTEHTLATDIRGGYQVIAADLNRDGRLDLVALGTGMSELVWFENPEWQRHVIVGGMSGMINVGAADSDGDGVPELVLAHGFATTPSRSTGIVSVLRARADPRGPWQATEIDRVTTSHRVRWADVAGDGRKVIVNAPLIGPRAQAPAYDDATPLIVYRPPEWRREVVTTENRGVVHGLTILDWDGAGRESLLTASFVGVHLHSLGRNGAWQRTEITKGDPAAYPRSGSSDVAVGRLDGSTRFLVTIEPWHGHQVAVYLRAGGQWQRNVIDTEINDGHTILVMDVNGDGRDEIVAGMRRDPQAVYLYTAADPSGRQWRRTTLDGSIGAAGCVAADLNGDSRPDLACVGTPSQTLKWYENGSPRE